MSGAKYYVWGGGRWRELDAGSGMVAGWARRPRFLFARRGRLRLASRRRVLAALQAHAAGRPGALGLGPRLSALSREPAASPNEIKGQQCAPPLYPPAQCEHHHCCMHFNRCNNNKQLTTCSHLDTHVVLSRCEVGTQHESRDHSQFAINVASKDANNLASKDANYLANKDVNNLASKDASPPIRRRAPPLDSLLDNHSTLAKRPRSAASDTDDLPLVPVNTKPNKVRRIQSQKREISVKDSKHEAMKPQAMSEDSADEGAACKELTISESDVSALRSFVARVREDALERFDADDSYKRMLFYAINPLVDVARCPRTEHALRERHAMALPHFAARLGLAPHARSAPPARSAPHARSSRRARTVSYRESSSTDADKENRRDTDDSADTHSDRSESDTFQKPRAIKRDMRTSLRKTRVTSDTEDEREQLKNNNDKKTITKSKANLRSSDSDTLKTIRHNKRENNFKISNKRKRDHSGSDRKRDREQKGTENKREINRNTSDRIRNIVKDKHEENTDSDDERETFQKTSEVRLNSLRRKTATPTKPNSYTYNDNKRENGANKRNALVTKNGKPTLVESDSDDSDTFVKKPVLRAKTNREDTDGNSIKNKRELNRRSSYRKHDEVLHKKTVVKDKEMTDSDNERDTFSKATEDRMKKKSITPTKPNNVNKQDRNNQNNANKRNVLVTSSKSTLVLESSSDGSDTYVKSSVAGSTKSSRTQGRPGPLELRSVNGDTDRLQPTVVIEPVTKAHKKRSAPTQAARTSTSTGSTSLVPGHIETHTISKRASGSRAKEYSSLEDHAIVAWVSAGARARRVNGNLLWRELQDQYQRLGGTHRSWHSLRNRYLRYILPALGALRLPPATAARLRAAAATGETKRKRVAVTARRNSIFDKETAARGASARRPAPRAPSPESPPPEDRGPRSPHKSPRGPQSRDPPRVKSQDEASTDEVVDESSKRRSLRQRVSSGPAPGPSGPAPGPSGPAPGPSGPAPGPSRTRRLFNPKLIL